MPFAGYSSFKDCVAKNHDKESPDGYCAGLQRAVEGTARVVAHKAWDQFLVADDSGVRLVTLSTGQLVTLAADELVTALEFDSGWEVLEDEEKCPACHGAGLKPERAMSDPQGQESCESCGGTGQAQPANADVCAAVLGLLPQPGHEAVDLTDGTPFAVLQTVSIQFSVAAPRKTRLGRKPTALEARLLSLHEIPEHLDAGRDGLRGALASALQAGTEIGPVFTAAMTREAEYGAAQVRLELSRQGLDVAQAVVPGEGLDALIASGTADLVAALKAEYEGLITRLRRRRLSETKRAATLRTLLERAAPGLVHRAADRGINEAFGYGRWVQLTDLQPAIMLARQRGEFDIDLSEIDVVHTAVLDQNLCEECEAVHGEIFDYGSARMDELEPPYIRCLGGNRCRCIHYALLKGSGFDVSEVTEEELENLLITPRREWPRGHGGKRVRPQFEQVPAAMARSVAEGVAAALPRRSRMVRTVERDPETHLITRIVDMPED